MLVKPTFGDDTYECYAVRIPKQHAFIFLCFLHVSTIVMLKVNFIMMIICATASIIFFNL